MEKNMTLAATYSLDKLSRQYDRRVELNCLLRISEDTPTPLFSEPFMAHGTIVR